MCRIKVSTILAMFVLNTLATIQKEPQEISRNYSSDFYNNHKSESVLDQFPSTTEGIVTQKESKAASNADQFAVYYNNQLQKLRKMRIVQHLINHHRPKVITTDHIKTWEQRFTPPAHPDFLDFRTDRPIVKSARVFDMDGVYIIRNGIKYTVDQYKMAYELNYDFRRQLYPQASFTRFNSLPKHSDNEYFTSSTDWNDRDKEYTEISHKNSTIQNNLSNGKPYFEEQNNDNLPPDPDSPDQLYMFKHPAGLKKLEVFVPLFKPNPEQIKPDVIKNNFSRPFSELSNEIVDVKDLELLNSEDSSLKFKHINKHVSNIDTERGKSKHYLSKSDNVGVVRSKRSIIENPIFSSVFGHEGRSGSLSERFFEGSRKNDHFWQQRNIISCQNKAFVPSPQYINDVSNSNSQQTVISQTHDIYTLPKEVTQKHWRAQLQNLPNIKIQKDWYEPILKNSKLHFPLESDLKYIVQSNVYGVSSTTSNQDEYRNINNQQYDLPKLKITNEWKHIKERTFKNIDFSVLHRALNKIEKSVLNDAVEKTTLKPQTNHNTLDLSKQHKITYYQYHVGSKTFGKPATLPNINILKPLKTVSNSNLPNKHNTFSFYQKVSNPPNISSSYKVSIRNGNLTSIHSDVKSINGKESNIPTIKLNHLLINPINSQTQPGNASSIVLKQISVLSDPSVNQTEHYDYFLPNKGILKPFNTKSQSTLYVSHVFKSENPKPNPHLANNNAIYYQRPNISLNAKSFDTFNYAGAVQLNRIGETKTFLPKKSNSVSFNYQYSLGFSKSNNSHILHKNKSFNHELPTSLSNISYLPTTHGNNFGKKEFLKLHNPDEIESKNKVNVHAISNVASIYNFNQTQTLVDNNAIFLPKLNSPVKFNTPLPKLLPSVIKSIQFNQIDLRKLSLPKINSNTASTNWQNNVYNAKTFSKLNDSKHYVHKLLNNANMIYLPKVQIPVNNYPSEFTTHSKAVSYQSRNISGLNNPNLVQNTYRFSVIPAIPKSDHSKETATKFTANKQLGLQKVLLPKQNIWQSNIHPSFNLIGHSIESLPGNSKDVTNFKTLFVKNQKSDIPKDFVLTKQNNLKTVYTFNLPIENKQLHNSPQTQTTPNQNNINLVLTSTQRSSFQKNDGTNQKDIKIKSNNLNTNPGFTNFNFWGTNHFNKTQSVTFTLAPQHKSNTSKFSVLQNTFTKSVNKAPGAISTLISHQTPNSNISTFRYTFTGTKLNNRNNSKPLAEANFQNIIPNNFNIPQGVTSSLKSQHIPNSKMSTSGYTFNGIILNNGNNLKPLAVSSFENVMPDNSNISPSGISYSLNQYTPSPNISTFGYTFNSITTNNANNSKPLAISNFQNTVLKNYNKSEIGIFSLLAQQVPSPSNVGYNFNSITVNNNSKIGAVNYNKHSLTTQQVPNLSPSTFGYALNSIAINNNSKPPGASGFQMFPSLKTESFRNIFSNITADNGKNYVYNLQNTVINNNNTTSHVKQTFTQIPFNPPEIKEKFPPTVNKISVDTISSFLNNVYKQSRIHNTKVFTNNIQDGPKSLDVKADAVKDNQIQNVNILSKFHRKSSSIIKPVTVESTTLRQNSFHSLKQYGPPQININDFQNIHTSKKDEGRISFKFPTRKYGFSDHNSFSSPMLSRKAYRPEKETFSINSRSDIPVEEDTGSKTVSTVPTNNKIINSINTLNIREEDDNVASASEKKMVLLKIIKRPIHRRKNIVTSTLRGEKIKDEVIYEKNNSRRNKF